MGIWAKEEFDELRRIAPGMSVPELAAHFGRTRDSIRAKLWRHRIGYKKNGLDWDYSRPVKDYSGIRLNVPRRVVDYWRLHRSVEEVRELLRGKVVVEG